MFGWIHYVFLERNKKCNYHFRFRDTINAQYKESLSFVRRQKKNKIGEEERLQL